MNTSSPPCLTPLLIDTQYKPPAAEDHINQERVALLSTPPEGMINAWREYEETATLRGANKRQLTRAWDAVRTYLDQVPEKYDALVAHEQWPQALEQGIRTATRRYAELVADGNKPPREHYILRAAATWLMELDNPIDPDSPDYLDQVQARHDARYELWNEFQDAGFEGDPAA